MCNHNRSSRKFSTTNKSLKRKSKLSKNKTLLQSSKEKNTKPLPFSELSETQRKRILRAAMNAEECRKENSSNKFFHGSVLVVGGKVISSGHNNCRTKRGRKITPSTHAEVDSLEKLYRSHGLYRFLWRQQCFERPAKVSKVAKVSAKVAPAA